MENTKIEVVIAVLVIIFSGLAVYLFFLDKKIKRMEKNKKIDND